MIKRSLCFCAARELHCTAANAIDLNHHCGSDWITSFCDNHFCNKLLRFVAMHRFNVIRNEVIIKMLTLLPVSIGAQSYTFTIHTVLYHVNTIYRLIFYPQTLFCTFHFPVASKSPCSINSSSASIIIICFHFTIHLHPCLHFCLLLCTCHFIPC